MKVLSKASVYGFRALIYMVSKTSEADYIRIGEISKELSISFHFLTKTFQSLSQAGILTSYRGPSGGVAFSIPPEQIFMIDIIKIIEGENFFDTCLLGLPGCGEATPCPVHDFWKTSKTALKKEFETTSLAELGRKANGEKIRLRP